MDKQDVAQGIAAGAIGFGVLAVAAPSTLLRMYGAEPTPSARSMTRLWGTRNIVLGLLTFQLEGDARDVALNSGMALNLADSVVSLLAPALDGMAPRTALAASLTSAGFAGAGGYAKSLG
jgi:hypothetical protein